MAPPADCWSATALLEQFGGIATFSLAKRTETAAAPATAAGSSMLDSQKRTAAAAAAAGNNEMPGAAVATPAKAARAPPRTSSDGAHGCMPGKALRATIISSSSYDSSSDGADPDGDTGAEALTPRRRLLIKQLSNSSCGSDELAVDAQQRLRDTEDDNRRLQAELARANKDKADLEARIAFLEAELRRMEQEVAYGTDGAVAAIAAIVKLNTVNAGLKDERTRLVKQVAELRGETDTLELDKIDLQYSLTKAKADTAAALAEADGLHQRLRKEMARSAEQHEEEIGFLLENAVDLERQLAAASSSSDVVYAARGRMLEALARQTCDEQGDTFIDDLLDNPDNLKAANGFEVLQEPRGFAGKNVQKMPDMALAARRASGGSESSSSPSSPQQPVYWAIKRFQFHSDECIAAGGIAEPVYMDDVSIEKLVLESVKGWPAEVQQRIICERQWTIRRNSQADTDPLGRDLELVIMFPFNASGDMAHYFDGLLLRLKADVAAQHLDRYAALRAAFRTALKLDAGLYRALAHLHKLGCIFNDVKPQNAAMVLADGSVSLLDVESIVALDAEVLGEPAVLATGLGTPGFIAPERLQEPQPVDGMRPFWASVKSDIYAADKSLEWMMRRIERHLGPQGLQELRQVSGVAQLQARCSAPFSARIGDSDAAADALYHILAREAAHMW